MAGRVINVTNPNLISTLEDKWSNKNQDTSNDRNVTDEKLISQLESNWADKNISPSNHGDENIKYPMGAYNPKEDLGIYDPANYSATGSWSPKSAAEHPISKLVNGILLQSLIPGGGSALGMSGKAIGDIGVGTLADLSNNPENMADEAKQGLISNSIIESLPTAFRGVGKAAELINPSKFAGKIAEKMRNIAQAGKKEGEDYYRPVHEKYDENIVTVDPAKYLGFKKRDINEFKPEVNKAYRLFKEDPTFRNLHDLQSKMGAYPELKPLRNDIKDRIASFLKQDPQALENYKMGSDTLRDKWYPYIADDTLKDIATTEKNITSHDPEKLLNSLIQNPLVHKSSKLKEPIDHPLVGFTNELKNKMKNAELYQYGIPAVASAIGGSLIHPALGGALGAGAGVAFGRLGSQTASHLAQNEKLVSLLKTLEKPYYAGARYELNNYE